MMNGSVQALVDRLSHGAAAVERISAGKVD
jgi:hypothetical protein